MVGPFPQSLVVGETKLERVGVKIRGPADNIVYRVPCSLNVRNPECIHQRLWMAWAVEKGKVVRHEADERDGTASSMPMATPITPNQRHVSPGELAG